MTAPTGFASFITGTVEGAEVASGLLVGEAALGPAGLIVGGAFLVGARRNSSDMLTERGERWHIFSITIAGVSWAAMLCGVYFAAASKAWVWLGVFSLMSIFQAGFIAFVANARRRCPPDTTSSK